MPHVSIELYLGRIKEHKARLTAAITQQFAKEHGSKPEDVTIMFKDVQPSDWFVSG